MDKQAVPPNDKLDEVLQAVTRLERAVAARLERDQNALAQLQDSLAVVEAEKTALAVAHNKAVDRLDQTINRLHKLFNP